MGSKKKANAEAAKAKKTAAAAKKAERDAKRQPNQNGVTRPKPGTRCAEAWDIFDTISKANRKPSTIGEAMARKPKKLNDATVRTQYSRWRKFHGVTGRLESATPKKAKVAKAAPKKKAAAKKASAPKKTAKKKAKAKTADAAPPVAPPAASAEAPAGSGEPTT